MKKIFGFAAIVAMVAAINVCLSSNNNEGLTALQLENVEYLAEAESGSLCRPVDQEIWCVIYYVNGNQSWKHWQVPYNYR